MVRWLPFSNAIYRPDIVAHAFVRRQRHLDLYEFATRQGYIETAFLKTKQNSNDKATNDF